MVEALFPYEFEIGDKVLAYHDGLLYEATCKNRKITDYGEISYFVHYKGFKSTFDEWSDADEVLAINDINLAHKETLESERKPCKRSNQVKKSRGPKKKNYASSPKPAKRKRGRPKKKVDKSAGPALEKFGVSPTAQLKEPVVKIIDIIKFRDPYTEKFLGAALKRFAKPARQAFAGPATSQLAKTVKSIIRTSSEAAVRLKRLKKSQKPRITHDTSSTKPANKKRGRPKKNVEQTARPIMPTSQFEEPSTTHFAGGPASVQFKELSVKITDMLKFAEPYSARSAELATAQLVEPAVEKSAETAIHKITEPTPIQFAVLATGESEQFSEIQEPHILKYTELDSAQSAKLPTAQLGEPAVEKSAETGIQTLIEPDPIQFAGLATGESEQFSEIQEPHIQKYTELDSARSAKLSTAQLGEPAVEKSVETGIQTLTDADPIQFAGLASGASGQFEEIQESDIQIYAEPDSAQFVKLPVEESELLKFAKPATTQSACPAKEHFVKASLEKSTESTINTFSEPAVRSKQVKKSQEPWLGSSTKPAKKKRGTPKKNVEQAAGVFTSQYAEQATTEFSELPVQTFSGPGTLQFPELDFNDSEIQQLEEPTVDQFAELSLFTFEEFAPTPFPELGSAQFAELSVENSDLQISAEPTTAHNAGPPTEHFVDIALENSTESAIQTFAGQTTSIFAEPVESTIHTFSEPAVRSKQVNQSQEPWLGSSTKPAKKNCGSPKKNVEQAAGVFTSQYAEQATTHFSELPVQTFSGPGTFQFPELDFNELDIQQLAEPTVDQFAELSLFAFEEFAPTPFPELGSAQFAELLVEDSDLQIFAEPTTAQNAGPPTEHFVDIALENSTESAIQTFAEPAVRSKQVKKSQEPCLCSSTKPPKKNEEDQKKM